MNNLQRQEDVEMGTSDMDRITLMVSRAVEEQQQSYKESAAELWRWHCPEMDSKNFWRLLSATAQAIMAKRGVYHRYVVDDNNREIIRQMWLYVLGSDQCQWNIHKGLYLGGKVGCGKTVLMQSFCHVLHLVSGLNIEMIPANELYKRIIKNGIESLASRPLFIDELGREQLEINDFGNKIRPINDLMALRYETGARTFFTSNFNIATLSKGYNEKGEMIGYGNYIGERIQEMANMAILPGESRREKWEEQP
ncbi:MAG: cell division protein ZapE [Prevotella sp.]|nr:cell division protein ZapE [Prevotella sp.]